MIPELDARVRDALQAAAETVEATARPFTVRQVILRGTATRWPWPVVALSAAAAVSLAVAVPYVLLNRPAERPVLPPPTTPPPLEKVQLPAQSEFMIAIDGSRATVQRAAAGETTEIEELPGAFWSATASPDGRTFYLSRSSASCASELVEVKVGDTGRVASTRPLPKTTVDGAILTNLALSPDGRQVAMTKYRESKVASSCRPTGPGFEVVVMQLATGARRSWSHTDGTGKQRWRNTLTWSLDGKSLVFGWPLDGTSVEPTALWALEVAAPTGALADAAEVVAPDERYAVVSVLTPGGTGMPYPDVLAAYVPQGGSRVLAYATDREGSEPVLVEIALSSGTIREVRR